MKIKHLAKLFAILAVILVLAFVVSTAVSAVQYRTTLNSAPFWVFILVHAATYLFPALLLLIAAFFFRKKGDKK